MEFTQARIEAVRPAHVAIIMDGNGRWARSRGLPRSEGHRQGAEALSRAVKGAIELELDYLTVFAFSLGRGSGAILWIGYFAYRDLVPKMAFHRAGYAVSHLSHPRHGFSKTRFAMRTLNRIPANRGDRYLRERVMMSLDGPVGAMRVLHRRLRENGVVSITVGGVARQPVMVPFMDGQIRLATGAPDLACATRAALLPVFPVRNEAGLLTVEVAPPLEVPDTSTRRGSSEAVLRQYAELLETQVLKYPGQWKGWFRL